MEFVPNHNFAESFCVPFLREAQNGDGGWGFQPGAQSRVEPTCWAVKAFFSRGDSSQADQRAIDQGLNFLRTSQLADGSWASTPEEKTGCWVTSLVCWVLAGARDEQFAKAIDAGLRWVCEDWPRDSSWLQRWVRKLRSADRISKQNNALRGWGWTPGTSSWVEPTAFALLALETKRAGELGELAQKRRRLGEALLYDRMCPGGGWNCGNPEVYGVAGEPLVIPTTWALLALREHSDQRENADSLAWMEGNFAKIQGPGSHALAQVCLAVYGREPSAGVDSAGDYHAKNESLRSIQAAAWTVLAGSDSQTWLGDRVRN